MESAIPLLGPRIQSYPIRIRNHGVLGTPPRVTVLLVCVSDLLERDKYEWFEINLKLTALPLSWFWTHEPAQGRTRDFLHNNGKIAAKQQYFPLEAETTLNLLSDRPPF